MERSLVMFPPQAWEEYQRHREEIAALLDPRCYSIDWLDAEILNGRARAIGNDTSVVVIAVRIYPAGASELHGLVAAGDLNSILELIVEAEEWGAALGITFACIASRPGWGRILKARGWKLHQTDLRKELSHGA